MTDATVAPNLPQWMRDHVARYQSSGGTDGHMYTITSPNVPAMSVPSLLLTTIGRKSGQKYLFPLFYGQTDGGYFVIAGDVPISVEIGRSSAAGLDVMLRRSAVQELV